MTPTRLEDFRFPVRVSTTDRRFPVITAWQRQRLVQVRAETRDVATVSLTEAGLERANAERGGR